MRDFYDRSELIFTDERKLVDLLSIWTVLGYLNNNEVQDLAGIHLSVCPKGLLVFVVKESQPL